MRETQMQAHESAREFFFHSDPFPREREGSMREARSVPECEASSWLWLWRIDILGFGALVGFLLALSRLELEFVHGGERHQRTWPHVQQLLRERIATSG